MIEEQQWESRYLNSAAGRIHYQDAGAGDTPPLILIHGGGPGAYGWSNYRRNAGPLSRNRRVIVIDLPGYGQSEARPVDEAGIYGANARAVLELMDALNIGKVSLVGNSLGGGISLRLALDHPERVDRLILMGPGGSIGATSTFPSEGLQRMLDFYEGEGPSLEKLRKVVDLLVYDPSVITESLLEERLATAQSPQTLKNPPLRRQAANPRNELWRENLAGLTHRTLLIWGREDKVLPLDMSFILLKLIPNADLHVFSKCGHWAQWEKADVFNQLVDQFLLAS
ncbi:alpha/beta fold hydrolase [Pandoraea fibrosis]|uniref:Alpha/beta fold hydrolase n=1 Tax=Pandoraea fibrosis TaxID=1891094 RepID=A0ABX6HVL9_9BURK|nr:alpha/beta fold hydrolase [Pandoraea fibrosis]QHE91519.1 alpha/beta fold hydrolase [Pandoraea fibrosis]QHF14923.1 alpha/beta fold hydrolase [Pandoraea fibrosis]